MPSKRGKKGGVYANVGVRRPSDWHRKLHQSRLPRADTWILPATNRTRMALTSMRAHSVLVGCATTTRNHFATMGLRQTLGVRGLPYPHPADGPPIALS
jgi:hypothetical protein